MSLALVPLGPDPRASGTAGCAAARLATVSLYVVQALLGHANARTTQRYAHLASDTLTDATEIVDGIVTAGAARAQMEVQTQTW